MRIVMMGTGGFAEPTFRALLTSSHQVVGLVTQPDRAAGQERGSTRQTGPSLKSIALEHRVPVFQPESVNTPQGIAGVQAFQPELLVVAAYGQILSKDVLAIPPHGGINVHASLLPKYRGAAPIAWAIYNGDKQTGVTIIRMSVYLDAGDMVAQEAIDIGPEETAGELEARLAPLGAKLALQVVDRITAGTPIQALKQDKTQVTKAPKLTKEHGLIDWSRTAAEVCNQIRAMQPWPTAYTFFHRQGQPPVRIIIHKGIALPMEYDPSLLAGAVFTDGRFPGWILVATGAFPSEALAGGQRFAISVAKLQPAGKRAMGAAEFLRGHPLKPGDRFGPETV